MVRNLLIKILQVIKLWKTVFWSLIVKVQCAGYEGRVRVNRKTKVTKYTFLGSNVNFNGMDITGCGQVHIGNNFHSGSECQIITSMHNYDDGEAIPYDSTNIHKRVEIEDNVWLGNRVIVLGGVCIGEGAIVQAGSVVVSDVSACSIVGGHPARVFSQRDLSHYNKLKALKKFN